MNDTVSWYITFGLGTPDGRTYTEVRVPASLTVGEQESEVRRAAVGAYGRQWAFNYPPEQFEASIAAYDLTLREVIWA